MRLDIPPFAELAGAETPETFEAPQGDGAEVGSLELRQGHQRSGTGERVEAHLVLSGAGCYRLRNSRVLVARSALLWIGPNTPYSFRANGKALVSVMSWDAHFAVAKLGFLALQLLEQNTVHRLLPAPRAQAISQVSDDILAAGSACSRHFGFAYLLARTWQETCDAESAQGSS